MIDLEGTGMRQAAKLGLAFAVWASAVGGVAFGANAPAFVPGSWTLAIVPDIQNDVLAPAQAQADWLVANKSALNIQYTLQLGDITHGDQPEQWNNVSTAFGKLDAAGMNYSIVPGNHDGVTQFNSYFPTTRLAQQPTYGGAFEAGKSQNTYSLFSAGGTDYVVMALEWAPRTSALDWAGSVLDTYSSRKAIVMTHAYLYYDDTRYDWATKGAAQENSPHENGSKLAPLGNDGQEIWDKLVKTRSNVEWVFSGHTLGDGNGRLDSVGTNGNVVHQVLANYQHGVQGIASNQGYLRLLEFQPDGKVQVKTYSPYVDTWKTDAANQFSYPLPAPRAAQSPVLIGHWTFDGESGQTVVDSSGKGHHGFLGRASGTTLNDPVRVSPGKSGAAGDSAIDTTGTLSHITVPTSADFAPTNGLTISAWVDSAQATGNQIIVSKHQGGQDGSYYIALAGGKLQFTLLTDDVGGVSRSDLFTSNIDYVNGGWHHFVATYDGDYMKIYWDDVLVARQAKGGTIHSTTSALRFGHYASFTSTDFQFNGLMDEISIWGMALDDGGAEIGQAAAFGSQIDGVYSQGVAALVPEPGTVGVLGLGGLLLLRRRQRKGSSCR
jgi:hypothetical protein